MMTKEGRVDKDNEIGIVRIKEKVERIMVNRKG